MAPAALIADLRCSWTVSLPIDPFFWRVTPTTTGETDLAPSGRTTETLSWRMEPDSMGRSLAQASNNVDFPEPLRPIKAMVSPFSR